MKSTILVNTQDDLFIVNTARTSFNSWQQSLDMRPNKKNVPKDVGLLSYLVREKHISPIFHIRFTMLISKQDLDLTTITDQSLLMRAVWKEVDSHLLAFRTSFYGWVRLIKTNTITNDFIVKRIKATLKLAAPITYSMYFGEDSIAPEYFEYPVTDDPMFVDVSIRIEAPIPIARQIFTHKEFDSNEVSRRYVSTTPNIYAPEVLHSRPEESIKQGIGEVHFITEALVAAYMASTARSLAEYELLIKSNVAPEEARFVLPQAMETTFIFTGSLNSWSKLVLNRMDSHAQLAVRSLALNIHEDLYRTYGKFYMDAYTNNVLLREADANY